MQGLKYHSRGCWRFRRQASTCIPSHEYSRGLYILALSQGFVHSLSTLPIRFLFLIQIPDSSPQHHPAGSAFKQAPVYRFPNPHIPSKNHFSQHRIFSSWSVRFWSFFGLCPLFLHSFSTLPIRFLIFRSRLLIPNSVHFLCDLRDL
jgi:hypothetical protein